MSLHDITDKSPNPELIDSLERLLSQAKTGEIRSMYSVIGWHDDQVTHGWVLDPRNTRRRMLAEMVMGQHDFVVNLELREGDSVLAENL